MFTHHSGARHAMGSHTYQSIWQAVEQIPAGRVATYGQIASVAGVGGNARLVGYALHRTPAGVVLPWHRVVTARGEIAFPAGSEMHARQRQRLIAEGVEFVRGRVDLVRFRWRPSAETLPEEYLRGCDNERS